jgi:hypothetical protein
LNTSSILPSRAEFFTELEKHTPKLSSPSVVAVATAALNAHNCRASKSCLSELRARVHYVGAFCEALVDLTMKIALYITSFFFVEEDQLERTEEGCKLACKSLMLAAIGIYSPEKAENICFKLIKNQIAKLSWKHHEAIQKYIELYQKYPQIKAMLGKIYTFFLTKRENETETKVQIYALLADLLDEVEKIVQQELGEVPQFSPTASPILRASSSILSTVSSPITEGVTARLGCAKVILQEAGQKDKSDPLYGSLEFNHISKEHESVRQALTQLEANLNKELGLPQTVIPPTADVASPPADTRSSWKDFFSFGIVDFDDDACDKPIPAKVKVVDEILPFDLSHLDHDLNQLKLAEDKDDWSLAIGSLFDKIDLEQTIDFASLIEKIVPNESLKNILTKWEARVLPLLGATSLAETALAVEKQERIRFFGALLNSLSDFLTHTILLLSLNPKHLLGMFAALGCMVVNFIGMFSPSLAFWLSKESSIFIPKVLLYWYSQEIITDLNLVSQSIKEHESKIDNALEWPPWLKKFYEGLNQVKNEPEKLNEYLVRELITENKQFIENLLGHEILEMGIQAFTGMIAENSSLYNPTSAIITGACRAGMATAKHFPEEIAYGVLKQSPPALQKRISITIKESSPLIPKISQAITFASALSALIQEIKTPTDLINQYDFAVIKLTED